MKLVTGKAAATEEKPTAKAFEARHPPLNTVHIHSIYRRMDDFGQCMVSNTRMAARAITRRYDAYLRPYGLTATQLSLMGAIRKMPDAAVSELAETWGFERTTLTRNLDRLEAMGLVVPRRGRGNARISEITPKGQALITELLPLWRRAQADMKAVLTREGFSETLTMLKRLAKVQETQHERS